MAFSQTIFLLATYKYFLLFPLSIIEGPIITTIAGFFVRTGVFSWYMVYVIVVLGDVFGDALAYSIGRFGGPVLFRKFSKFFRITEQKMEKARTLFNMHHNKTIIFSKIMHGVGIAGLMTAGNLKVPYKKFFLSCISVSLVQSAFFLLIGILFGHAYIIIEKYINFFSKGTLVVGVIIALILFFYFRLKKV